MRQNAAKHFNKCKVLQVPTCLKDKDQIYSILFECVDCRPLCVRNPDTTRNSKNVNQNLQTMLELKISESKIVQISTFLDQISYWGGIFSDGSLCPEIIVQPKYSHYLVRF